MGKKEVNGFIKYSGIGIQMLGTMVLCGWLGTFIDKKLNTTQPFFTLIGLLLGVVASIISIVRNLNKNEK